jgi:hypothetical protein
VEFQIGRADGPTMELAAEPREDSTRGYRADDAILRRASLRLMNDATPDVDFLRSYHGPILKFGLRIDCNTTTAGRKRSYAQP